MTPPPEFSEPRRSFVKKTLATSVSISFAGLIRAHGEGGTTGTITTSYDPQQTHTTTESLTTTYDPQQTEATTGSQTTTYDPQQTEATTGSQTTVNEDDYKLRIERGEIIEMDKNTFNYLFHYNFTFGKPPRFDEDPRERSADFVAVRKGTPTEKENWSSQEQGAGSIKVTHKHNGEDRLDFRANLKWDLTLEIMIPSDSQPLHVDKDCLKCEVKAPSLKLLLVTPPIESDPKMTNFQNILDSSFKASGTKQVGGVTVSAVKKETPVENKPSKLEAMVHTEKPAVSGDLQSTSGDIRTTIVGTIKPEVDANSVTVTWDVAVKSPWAEGLEALKNRLKDEIEQIYQTQGETTVEVTLIPFVFPSPKREQVATAYFSPWVKAGAGCSYS